MFARLAAATLAASSLFSANAQADEAEGAEYEDLSEEPLLPVRLDGHASITWDGYFGLGARVDIPLIKDGLSYNSKDELAISVGVDVAFVSFSEGDDPLQVWPTAAVQWSLGVTPKFAFYPELGLAAKIERDGWDGVYPNVGFGGRYSLWRSVALLGRVGWPMAISLGGTF
ncbi:MAG: hypothetical protein QM778_03670 [Myxococcales bacterium]